MTNPEPNNSFETSEDKKVEVFNQYPAEKAGLVRFIKPKALTLKN